jgi:hypothetical protein
MVVLDLLSEMRKLNQLEVPKHELEQDRNLRSVCFSNPILLTASLKKPMLSPSKKIVADQTAITQVRESEKIVNIVLPLPSSKCEAMVSDLRHQKNNLPYAKTKYLKQKRQLQSSFAQNPLALKETSKCKQKAKMQALQQTAQVKFFVLGARKMLTKKNYHSRDPLSICCNEIDTYHEEHIYSNVSTAKNTKSSMV